MTTNTEKTKLSEAAAAARREYQRRWRSEHPDACKRYRMNFWEKKAVKAAGEQKE